MQARRRPGGRVLQDSLDARSLRDCLRHPSAPSCRLTGDRHARPGVPGRSCRIAPSVRKEVASLRPCLFFARIAPIRLWGGDPAKGLKRWPRVRGVIVLIPPPPPVGERGELRRKVSPWPAVLPVPPQTGQHRAVRNAAVAVAGRPLPLPYAAASPLASATAPPRSWTTYRRRCSCISFSTSAERSKPIMVA